VGYNKLPFQGRIFACAHHEGISESGCIITFILNHGYTYRFVVGFSLDFFTPDECSRSVVLVTELVWTMYNRDNFLALAED